ncbi:YitT family protein [Nocardioides sp. TF02-7]|uniref:YitT family protein n=1 Tax=Nocardioides sp. TF02-7 TaxID=2917724 RepID=UPI001F05404E|nr:YitT family protein [Nocardioides sp. TF02-7]UMG94761.1 YitT family protein [Nocardioides sp. TF02-7]
MVGVSIIATNFVDVPMGVFIGLLNIPFVLLAWALIGHRSAVRSGVGIATLSAATIYLHHMHAFTDESWLALICGGAMIAVGIGIALRHGGALDGTEVLATILASRTPYTVGQLILYINLGIFTVAGFVISWESALLSAVLFYIVVKDLVDQIAHGEAGARRARVTTARHEDVATMIAGRTGRPVLVDVHTRWYADGPGEDVWVVNFTCSRMEEATLVEDIEAVDPDANVTFSDITTLHGPMFESLATGH